MARINLLPWREVQRDRKNKEFITLVAFCLLAGLLSIFAVWFYFNSVLKNQQAANELIKLENNKLDAELAEIAILDAQREEMNSRIGVVHNLQGKRALPVKVWGDIAKAIPAKLYLTLFKREGDVLTLAGKAENPNIVSLLILNLDDSHLLKESKVNFIKQNIDAYHNNATNHSSATNTGVKDNVDNSTNSQYQDVTSQVGNEGSQLYPEDSYLEFEITTFIDKQAESIPVDAKPDVEFVTNSTDTAVSSIVGDE